MTKRISADKKQANNAIDVLLKIKAELDKFINTNDEVFDEFLDLADRLNCARDAAIAAARNLEGGYKYRAISLTHPKEKISYDASELPPAILTMPGVVKTVDADVIGQLIQAGKIPQSAVTKAQGFTTATPSVRCSVKAVNLGL